MEPICCVILAAGLGKRLGGDLPKAITHTRQGALIDLALEGLAALKPSKTIIVVGHRRELVEQHLATSVHAAKHTIEFVYQSEQLGTGHAVQCALSAVGTFQGTVVISYADLPLFRGETFTHFVAFHTFKRATLSMITCMVTPPHSYGRVVRGGKGDVLRVTEAKDCSPEDLLVSEINSGVYAVDSAFLKPAIESLTNTNAQREYYLTDIVAKAVSEGQTVCAFPLGDATEVAGVNTPQDLAYVNRVLEQRQIHRLIDAGVHFSDPQSCSIDPAVTIESGARIGPQVQLRGATSIAGEAVIEGSSLIIDSAIGRRAQIKLSSRIEGASVGADSAVGPFANVRPGTVLGTHVRIGNFVEVKNATLSDGAKASHLSYLGDCSVGEDTNIGAGTITCNYDGYNKSKTTIGKGVFIGSNSCLVAPLTIGDQSLIAAGSVITKDVPTEALALGRSRQENKAGWAKRRHEALSKKR